jgi:hypothetical protein
MNISIRGQTINSRAFPYVLFVNLPNIFLGVAVSLFNFIHNSHQYRNIIFITLFTLGFSAATVTCLNWTTNTEIMSDDTSA